MDKLFVGQRKNGASMTKIVWTLGPESRSVERIEKLLQAGMNVARFNFSYGSHAYHQETLNNLRTAIQNTGILCAVMLDTKGPEIRTGFLIEGKPIELTKGQEITVSIDYTIKGDSNMISVSYDKLAEHLKPGCVILCSDGTISLTVLSCDQSRGLVRCRCDNSALLGEREKVHLPLIETDLPALTDQDKEDILQWGLPNKINIIALSFVRKGSDVDQVRRLLGVHRNSIMLMSKIENEEGVANVDEIMERSDALLVARGDLSLELPPQWATVAQKRIIENANSLGKPIVIAIQMLDSMSTRPTMAEATDITKAVLEGTDCVMLSGVTVSHPETVVETLSRLCKEAEVSIDYRALHLRIKRAIQSPTSKSERTTASTVTIVAPKMNAKAIVVVAKSGFKAEIVAKYRPSVPILSVVDRECPDMEAHVASRDLVYSGIIPLMGSGASKSTEGLIRFGIQVARDEGICKVGDLVLALNVVNGCNLIFKFSSNLISLSLILLNN